MARLKLKFSISTSNVTDALRKAVVVRDFNTCQYCDFRSAKYQWAAALSDNPHDIDQIATACIFCHQCLYFEQVAHMRSGVLLWMPEMEQAALHQLAREIYVARVSSGPMGENARRALDQLMTRRTGAKERLGSDSPADLLERVQQRNGREIEETLLVTEGIRLFPLDRRILREADLEFNQFPQILAFWRSKAGPFQRDTPLRALESYANTYLSGDRSG